MKRPPRKRAKLDTDVESESKDATSTVSLDRRRRDRQKEMKRRLADFRPKLENFARHKLFIDADLLELPKVKELVEENNCTIPVTDERWKPIQDVLLDTVRAHARTIEDDCYHAIDRAKVDAWDAAKEQWWEKEIERWEKNREELRALKEGERESVGSGSGSGSEEDSNEDSDTSEDSSYPVPESPPDELKELEDEYHFDEGWNRDPGVMDEDLVTPRLLSASSLFRQKSAGDRLTGYEDILRRRALLSFPFTTLSEGEPVAWCKEQITSSVQVVETARKLLAYLRLPVETTMAYMMKCGDVFRCIRCYRGPASRGVSWPALVQHFIYQNDQYEDLCERNRNREANVPLRNDHSLEIEDIRSQGFYPVHRPTPLNVPFEPRSTNETRYSVLSTTWGTETPTYLKSFMNANNDEEAPVGILWGDLESYSSDEMLHEPYEYTEKCKLCAKLDVKYAVRSPIRLKDHMKMKHGTDAQGNRLSEEQLNG